LDAFWLYKLMPNFNLRVKGRNLFEAKSARETEYLSGSDTYRLSTVGKGARRLLVTLESRW
jgi:hypothetical protein